MELRAKTNFLKQIRLIPPVQPLREKHFPSRFPQIKSITPASRPTERGVGHRHERWDGRRWTRQRRARKADRRAGCPVSDRGARTNGGASGFINASAGVHTPLSLLAKAGRGRQNRVVLAPVAGVKSAEVLVSPTGSGKAIQSADDGDKTNSSPGRARHKPLKPFACGNAGLFPVTCGDYRVLPCCTRAVGASGARHSPRPLQ
jgi:hypothetical protein